ncbi:hypothetical protein H4S00_001987 [Coemansia sp. D1744]|nr:hypothetical protein H4S00_001987 [Coemansia sp. D1744]
MRPPPITAPYCGKDSRLAAHLQTRLRPLAAAGSGKCVLKKKWGARFRCFYSAFAKEPGTLTAPAVCRDFHAFDWAKKCKYLAEAL